MTRKILIAHPEASGGQWFARLLRSHPEAPEIIENSYPSQWAPQTYMPDYSGDRAITDLVVVVRQWFITRRSQQRMGYLRDHPPELTDSHEVVHAIRREMTGRRVHWASYGILNGPFGRDHFETILLALGLKPLRFPWDQFDPVDADAKYLVP